MTTMRLTILILPIVLLSNCLGKGKADFEASKGVVLTSNMTYSPLHIWRITEHPSRFGCMWNDSIIQLLHIRRLVICCKGGTSPDATSEKLIYEFDSNGLFTRFEYFNEEKDKNAPLSVFRRAKKGDGYLRIDIDKFFGSESAEWIEQKEGDKSSYFIRHRINALEDTISMIELDNIAIRMEKIGKNISGIRFLIPKGVTLRKAVDQLHGLGISDDELMYANKLVTYTSKGLPTVSYELTSDWIQKEKIEEWTYSNFRVLESYEHFVNQTSVKKMTFTYSEDLILRSFVSNGRTYQISYK